MISIHALREEGDDAVPVCFDDLWEFLSTPSARRATLASRICSSTATVFLSTPSARRATLTEATAIALAALFLSTPSARRATDLIEPEAVERKISIHALREEGDCAV